MSGYPCPCCDPQTCDECFPDGYVNEDIEFDLGAKGVIVAAPTITDCRWQGGDADCSVPEVEARYTSGSGWRGIVDPHGNGFDPIWQTAFFDSCDELFAAGGVTFTKFGAGADPCSWGTSFTGVLTRIPN